jgi:uncharacterized membrane protein YbhN (UPF0104 family)
MCSVVPTVTHEWLTGLRVHWIGWLLRLAFAALLLVLVLTRVDLAKVGATLSAIDLRFLLPALVLNLVFRYLLAYQMYLGMGPLRLGFRASHLLKIGFIAGFYALALPGGMLPGAAAAWFKLSRGEGIAVEAGTLVVYIRLVNTLTMLAIGLIALFCDPAGGSAAARLTVGAFFVVALLCYMPFASPRVAGWLVRLARGIPRWGSLPARMRNKALEVWQAVSAFHGMRPRTVLSIFALSLLSNLLGVVVWFLLARAEGVRISVLAIGWVSSLLTVVQMVPVSVAGLGTREATLVVLMGHCGISQEQAVSFSFGLFGLTVLFAVVGGLLEGWDLLRGGSTLRDHLSRREEGT